MLLEPPDFHSHSQNLLNSDTQQLTCSSIRKQLQTKSTAAAPKKTENLNTVHIKIKNENVINTNKKT